MSKLSLNSATKQMTSNNKNNKNNNPFNFKKDTWTIIKEYFKTGILIKHQLDSFNGQPKNRYVTIYLWRYR